MTIRLLLGGIALALATTPAMAADKIKVGFITQFPCPVFRDNGERGEGLGQSAPRMSRSFTARARTTTTSTVRSR